MHSRTGSGLLWRLAAVLIFLAVAAPAQTPISVGQTVNGTLSTSSSRLSNTCNCWVDTYRLTLAGNQEVEIRMSSSVFDTYLGITDTNFNVIAEDDDGGGGTNSLLRRTLNAGTYYILATSYAAVSGGEGAVGAYTLAVVGTSARPPTPITIGQTVNGNLTENSSRSVAKPGSYADFYTFTITSAQQLVIQMSAAFDTFVAVYDAAGTQVTFDDDGGDGTNSRINYTFTAGTYRIEATSYSQATGAYTLRLSSAAASARPIAVGQSLTGQLAASSERSTACAGCYADYYQFTVASAQTLVIRMSSGDFDTVVRLLDSTGNQVAVDDDSGGGTNSLLMRQFTPGTYRIEATTYSAGNSGTYTISLQAGATGGTAINIGDTRNGNLSAASGRSAGCAGCFTDLYQFTVNAAQTVVIRMNSSAFDTYLRVLNAANTTVVEDDDGGGGTNSQVIFTFQPGTYRVEATTYNAGDSGAYSIALAAPPAPAATIPLPVGQSRDDFLSSSSGRGGACNTCFAQIYTFTLTANASLVIEMSSRSFDTYLRLLTDTGTVIATDDDSGGGTNSRIARSFTPGTYRIEATTYSPGQAGPFTLSLRVDVPIVVQNISIGATANGALSANSPRPAGLGGRFADTYQFTLSGAQQVTIGVVSTAFDSFLIVRDSNGGVVGADDDGGGDTNSRITRNFAAGTYRIEVTTYSVGETGAYQLSLVAGAVTPPPVVTGLSPSRVPAGGSTFTLGVIGNNFTSGSIVRWNGSDRPTRVAGDRLEATINGADIATAGTAAVSVFTPPPGGGNSNRLAFTITSSAAALSVTPNVLQFTTIQSVSPASQAMILTNEGRGSLNWQAAIRTANNIPWLTVAPASGSVQNGQPVRPTVSVNAASLPVGTHAGLINLTDSAGGEQRVWVIVLVTRASPIIRLTQPGLIFTAAEGATSVAPQALGVLNSGQGTLNWSVRATTSDGRNWLTATPTRGSSTPGAAGVSSVNVSVNPAGLRAGTYSGLLTFDAPGANNSPYTSIVLLNVQPAGASSVGAVRPAGLTFVIGSGRSPAPQTIQVSGGGAKSVTYTARVATRSGGNWLSVNPASGALADSGAASSISVQPASSALAPGTYNGTVTVELSNGTTQTVGIAVVVTPPGAFSATPANLREAGLDVLPQADCTPTRATMVETVLPSSFALTVRWPVAMLVQVVNDCGQAVTGANVTANFSNGDPTLRFDDLGTGQYSKIWSPGRNANSVVVTMRAATPSLPTAELQLEGKVNASAGTPRPLVPDNGTVNGASFAGSQPLAPGSIISVFGQNLSTATSIASSAPLPRALNEVQVTIGGIQAPLFFVSTGQINAQVPIDLQAGTTASLVVSVNRVPAAPAEVALAAAQPGIFIMDAATNQAAVIHPDGRLVNSSNAAAANDVVLVYATGLGVTTNPVATGTAAPSSPLSEVRDWRNRVTVTIGGRPAEMFFAGLAPGFIGLYQMNVRVPTGVAAGNSVPVVVSVDGVNSNSANIAVR